MEYAMEYVAIIMRSRAALLSAHGRGVSLWGAPGGAAVRLTALAVL